MNARTEPSLPLPDCLSSFATMPQWVGWRWQIARDKAGQGKRTKVPRQITGELARNNDPTTWSTAAEVVRAASSQRFDGLGLQLRGLEGFAALDLDNVRNPEAGAVLPWAASLMGWGSYAEVTPSGRGLRVLGLVGPEATPLHRKFAHPEGGEVEFYVNTPTGRYITVTGNRVSGTPDALAPIGPLVEKLWAEVNPDRSEPDFDFSGSREQSDPPPDFANLPRWVQDTIAHGRTGDRSGDFQAVVNYLFARGMSFTAALRLFEAHPEGPASKYQGRLKSELHRSLKKAAASRRGRVQAAANRQGSKPSWLGDCILDARNKKPVPNLSNVMVAFRRDPTLLDVVAFDQMASLPILTRAMPRAGAPGGLIDQRPVTDQDAGALQEYLQQVGLTRVSREIVLQALDLRAHERAFHPVRNYLSAAKWDGRPRLASWLSDYLGAEASAYTSAIGQMFLVAMVARVFKPGCKVDHLLVLEGPQGARKSTACAILGGPWFSDALPDIREGKDAAAHLNGKWLIEVGEMHALGKAEAALLKSFITRTTERYRTAYGRLEITQPRQCIFVGTTNESEYLRDASGGRRFWPVKVGTIDTDALTRDRGQLFAEATAAFRGGQPWWPAATFEREQIAPQQEQRFEADAWEQAIADFFKLHKQATVSEVARGALGFEMAKIGTADQRRIAAVLEHLGLLKLPKDGRGNRCWSRP